MLCLTTPEISNVNNYYLAENIPANDLLLVTAVAHFLVWITSDNILLRCMRMSQSRPAPWQRQVRVINVTSRLVARETLVVLELKVTPTQALVVNLGRRSRPRRPPTIPGFSPAEMQPAR